MKYTDIVIDFFDYSERPENRDYVLEGHVLSASWQDMAFPQEDIKLYDLVIDDAWTYAEGPGLKVKYPNQYSMKGAIQIVDGFEPFLHPTEVRKFSEPPLKKVLTGCKCPVCRQIKNSVETYEEYLLVRYLCARLGYTPPCEGLQYQGDLARVGDYLRALYTSPEVQVKSLAAYKSLMALSEEVALEVSGHVVRQKEGGPKFTPLWRMQPKDSLLDNTKVYPDLEGKKVLFVGVPSTTLGSTKIRDQKTGTNPAEVDVIFLRTVDSWKQHMESKIVYAPFRPQTVAQVFLDWEHTGKKCGQYYEYVRQHEVEQVVKVFPSPGMKVGGQMYPVHPLYPYLDVSILRSPLGEQYKKKVRKAFPDRPILLPTGGTPYTMDYKDGVVTLVPFEFRRWRQSIYVNKDRTYTMALNAFNHIHHQSPNFEWLWLHFPAPWDLTQEEYKRCEKIYGVCPYPREQCTQNNIVMHYRGAPSFEFTTRASSKIGKVGMYYRSQYAHPLSWEQGGYSLDQSWRQLPWRQGYEKVQLELERVYALSL